MSDDWLDEGNMFDASDDAAANIAGAEANPFAARIHTPAWLNDYAQPSRADEVMARMAAQRAAYDAGAEERQRRDAEQAAANAEWRAREDARLAAERVEVERLAKEQAMADARRAADDAEQEAAWQAREAAMEAQDEDYHALSFWLDFKGFDIPGYDEPLDDSMRIDLGELSDDEGHNARAERKLRNEISAALDELCALYLSMGLVRADNLGWLKCDGQPSGAPRFFLVHGAADETGHPELLAEFAERRIASQAVPGATLTFGVIAQPFNASALFERAQAHGLAAGEWCQDCATPEFAPRPDESREEWLVRVAMPAEEVHRNLARRKRSGGNLKLFKAAGAASGTTALDKPLMPIIPGLLYRGVLTALVGTKGAGKSTLLGEILAVTDSQCVTTRSLLGVEVTARGAGCLVSAEDRLNFVATRNSYYEPVHGDALGFAFDTAEEPWDDVVKTLYEIEKGSIDVLGIDPLRGVMPGDEDASGNVSKFLDDLNALAQYHDCAVIFVHHLSKGDVRSLSRMLPAVRGSGVITDRPRMVIGMIDRGAGITEIGIIKQNIPPSEKLWGEVNVGRLFRRDLTTLTLVPVEVSARFAERTAPTTTIELIYEAVRDQNRLRLTLRRTGKSELYERKVPQLSAVSRSAIRDGVSALLASGRLADGPDGIQAVDAETP